MTNEAAERLERLERLVTVMYPHSGPLMLEAYRAEERRHVIAQIKADPRSERVKDDWMIAEATFRDLSTPEQKR